MTQIAFITRQAPHGSAVAREAQDAIFATSTLTEELSVFFMGDGVFQLVENQQPEHIHSRHFANTFKLFELYDIENIYVCANALSERGLSADELLIDVTLLAQDEMNDLIRTHSKILNF